MKRIEAHQQADRPDGSSRTSETDDDSRLARPSELERTWTSERGATLAASRGPERLDRFELAVAFAIREASRRRNERFGRHEIDTEEGIG